MGKFVVLALLLGAGCSSGSHDQVITGRVGTNFPAPVTSVRAVRNGAVIATSNVAADGSFRLAVAPHSGVAIQLVSSAKTTLVFPRHSGGTPSLFAIRSGGAPFDLGTVHYIGAIGSTPIVFRDGTTTSCSDDGTDASGDVCADDGDSDHGTCEAESESEGADDNGMDDVDDGLEDAGDAVADHNFPADGCADDDADESEGSDDHGSDA